jgi:hypothetical protein
VIAVERVTIAGAVGGGGKGGSDLQRFGAADILARGWRRVGGKRR